MAHIDPSTNLGKVRLKIADFGDIHVLSDEIIEQVLADNEDNVNRAAAECAQYVLGILSANTHKKLVQLEVWGAERFNNYVKFLQMTILNPNLNHVCPIPYTGSAAEEESEIVEFMQAWKAGYNTGSVVIQPQGPATAIEYAY